MKLLSWLFSTITNTLEIFLFILWIIMLDGSFRYQGLFGLFYGLFFGLMIIFLIAYFKRKSVEKTSDFDHELSVSDLQKMLEKITTNIKNRVSNLIFEKVIKIADNLFILLPLLNNKTSLGYYETHLVKKTITHYLPQTLTAYLELPVDFANTHKMKNGKTSQQSLIEQLDILDEQIQNISANINHKKLDALIIQGEFLKSKFADDEDWL